MSSNTTPRIVAFYDEGTRDFNGRRLLDILDYDNRTLEMKHDYIQVLFPLPEGSPFNSQAPVIMGVTRDAFLDNSNLRGRLFDVCGRLAAFYGFDIVIEEGDYTFVPKPDFKRLASDSWLMRMNHNHLRITRIIRCLRVLGHERLALAFYDALLREDASAGDKVSERSLMYWSRAAKRPLHLPPDEDDESAEGIAWLRDAESSG